MQQISSLQNSIIKDVADLRQKKNRRDANLFIIEGFKGVQDALNYGLEITHIFIKKEMLSLFSCHCEAVLQPKQSIILTDSNGLPRFTRNDLDSLIYLVNDRILKKISTTDTPCEILAVAKQFKYKLNDFLKENNPLIVVLENIKDPGNLGTIIRTAKAANASGIILTGETADIFNPKTVRSSAANLWKIPILNIDEKHKIKEILNSYKDFQFIATSLSDKTPKIYFKADYKTPSVIMFGSEAEGLSDKLIQQADINIKIPMNSEVESLNIGVSVGIVLYEAVRQRNFL